MSPLRHVIPILPVVLVIACGNPAGPPQGGAAGTTAADAVVVSGHIAAPGTKGPLLVFALAGNAGEPAERETLSLAAVDPAGDFALSLPPVEALSFAFLADGANDGVIDGGDPTAVLSGPALANLGAGDVVILGDVALDFANHRASAGSIDVQHAGVPASTRTPTPLPAE